MNNSCSTIRSLATVRFELGVLYYRLGAYEMAHEYFTTALKMPDVTPDLRQRTEDLLAAVDKKLLPDQFSGYAQTGLRYQTNAAVGPSQQTVLASRQLFNKQFAARPDGNWFGAFGLNYVHDFENQRGDTFEANALGYDAQQFTLHQFDIGLLEFRAGPRFGIPTATPIGLSIKPYVVAMGGVLADAPYYGSLGGGLTVHVNVGNVALDPYAEVVQQSFRNLTLYPLASGQNGPLQTYGLQASGPVVSSLSFQTRVVYAHADATFNPFGYNSYAADLWLPWNFSPLGDGRTWTLTPTAGFTQWQYNAPDPAIDPLTTPHILEWRVGLGLEFPIWNKLFSPPRCSTAPICRTSPLSRCTTFRWRPVRPFGFEGSNDSPKPTCRCRDKRRVGHCAGCGPTGRHCDRRQSIVGKHTSRRGDGTADRRRAYRS